MLVHGGIGTTRKFATELCVLCLMLTCSVAQGCGNRASAVVNLAADAATPDATVCATVQQTGPTQCCPAGHHYVYATDSCLAIGPRSCRATLFAAPADCTPTWCADDMDDKAQPCADETAGCRPVARECSDAEALGRVGCVAGWWRPSAAVPCRPAGLDSGACSGNFVANSADNAACNAVGTPWSCPPGFTAGPLATCVPSTSDCPEDAYGGLSEQAGTVFVDPLAAAGGDGSRAKPLNSLKAALSADSSPTTIALAAGNYEESNLIKRPVAITGRCAALVHISGKAGKAALWFEGPGGGMNAALHGVTVSGPAEAVVVSGAMPVFLYRVWLHQAHGAGLLVLGGDEHLAWAELTDAVVADTQMNLPGMPELGRGIEVVEGAHLQLDKVQIQGGYGIALAAGDLNSTVVGEQVLISDVDESPQSAGNGHGVRAIDGANISLKLVHLQRCRGVAAEAVGAGSRMHLRQVIIEDTLPHKGDGEGGFGLEVINGATAVVDHGLLRLNRQVGLSAWGSGSQLLARDVVVADTQATMDGHFGRGAQVVQGGQLRWIGGASVKNREIAILVTGAGSVAELVGLHVTATLPELATADWGRGLDASAGARVAVAGCLFENNRDVGLAAWDKDTSLQVAGSVVTGTATRLTDGQDGHGIAARDGAALALQSVAISNNYTAAVVVYQAALLAQDSVFASTRMAEYSTAESATALRVGDGILAFNATSVALGSCLAVGAARAGLLLAGGAPAKVAQFAATGNVIGISSQNGASFSPGGGMAWLDIQDYLIDGALGLPPMPEAVKGL